MGLLSRQQALEDERARMIASNHKCTKEVCQLPVHQSSHSSASKSYIDFNVIYRRAAQRSCAVRVDRPDRLF
eukprot:5485351-Pleurochrysis_carterae.AAC.1